MVESQINNNIIEIREDINDFNLDNFNFENEEKYLNDSKIFDIFELNEEFKYKSINEYNNEKIYNIFVKEPDTNFKDYIINLHNINNEFSDKIKNIENIKKEFIMKSSGRFKKKINFNLDEIKKNYISNFDILKNKPLIIKDNMKSIYEIKNSLYYFIHEMENDFNDYDNNINRFEKKIENLIKNIEKLNKEYKKFDNKLKLDKITINEEEIKIEEQKKNLEYNIKEIEESKKYFKQINDLNIKLDKSKCEFKILEEEVIKLKNSKLYHNDKIKTILQNNNENKENEIKNKILEKDEETIKNNNDFISHSLNINQLNFFLFIIFNIILILKIIYNYNFK